MFISNELMNGFSKETMEFKSKEIFRAEKEDIQEEEIFEAMVNSMLMDLATFEQKETVVEVLVDEVKFDKKPVGKEIGAITKRLPQHPQKVTLKSLADLTVKGYSWKASVLTGTNNTSFVSSSLVALDIDNKESYTSVVDFLALNQKYQPCFIYETFSSTKECERFRAVFAFDKVITDYDMMCSLYEEVKAQYPGVEFDDSVDPGKVLFGGKVLRYFNDTTNKMPSLTKSVCNNRKKYTSNKVVGSTDKKIVFTPDMLDNYLESIADNFKDLKELDYLNAYDWINKNIKISEILNVEENVYFRCVLPNHEDNNPSARIDTCEEEQIYFCSCSVNGSRVLPLLSKLLDMSIPRTIITILNKLNIRWGSEYQRNAKDYIDEITRNFNKTLGDTVSNYLKIRKLYRPYKALINFARIHVHYRPLTVYEDKVTFFLSKRQFEELMKEECIPGDASNKLLSLCELGFIRKMKDEEIRPDLLEILNKSRKKLENRLTKNNDSNVNVNRCECYELIDLAPSLIESIEDTIKTNKECAFRQKGNNINRRVAMYGVDKVTNDIHVQSKVSVKKQEKKLNKLENVLLDLLTTNEYINEFDLAEAYRATDKKHITKAIANKVVLDYIPALISKGLIKRIRVNKDTRRKYKVSKKYKSNSFIYIKNN